MKILHLTDIHSDFLRLWQVISSNKVDLILLSGDITHFAGKNELIKAVEILNGSNTPFFAVTGNCDKPECEQFLLNKNLSLDSRIKNFDFVQLAGLGGSLPCPGTTPNEFSEEEFSKKCSSIEDNLSPAKPLIFMPHQPPHNTLNDKVIAGFHVGSKPVRGFIEKNKPVLCLTGHIHEGKGVDYIGECPVINPGPLRNGCFAIIELTGEQPPHIELH